MAKISLRATGGLNQDIDPNNLPEGDYLTANNIIFDAGKDGGAGAIRMLDSIKTTGLTAISGTIVDTAQDTDGSIYVLAFVTTVASIYKIGVNSSTGALENPILVLSYTHGATNGLIPDLRIIGDSLVWNYAGDGTPLSFWFNQSNVNNRRTLGQTLALEDLTLQKATPNNVSTIVKTVTSGTAIAVEFLESTDFQFAYRYQYDNYEYSALSNYTQIYKGEKNTVKYAFSYSFTGKPAYAKYLEVYVRIGNNGTWRRIDSNLIGTDSATFEWTGQIFESLDIITTGKPFDAVPVWAKNIEVAKNRIFLANIQDDYSSDVGTITIGEPTASLGYTLPAGSTHKSYLGDSAGASSIELDASNYIKPFANNSTYAIGLAYYDKAMKTRGVEKYKKFTTGKFGGVSGSTIPLVPNITATVANIPTWVKFAQFVYTKNISKSYVFEGYASSIFFELKKTNVDEKTKEVTTLLSFVQSVTKDDLKEINAFVIDMMGMIRAGRIYTWQQGDYVSINTPNGVLDLKIIGQNDNLLYCAYSGDVMTNTTTVDPSTLAFEIFTPKQQQEDESLVFYEYGNLIPIVTTGGSPTTSIAVTAAGPLNGPASGSKLLGDMVFSTIDMPTYVTSPFTTDTSKGSPVVEDVVTIVNSTHAFSSGFQQSSTAGGSYVATPVKQVPVLTSIPTNGDGASIVDSKAFKLSGYYIQGEQETGVNKMTIQYNLQATRTMVWTSPTAYGQAYYTITAQVYKTPYNNTLGLYDKKAERFGLPFIIGGSTQIIIEEMSNSVIDLVGTQTIDLKTDIKEDINPNDKFEVELTFEFTSDGDVASTIVTVAKKSASTNSVVITLSGDRTPVKTITSYNYNAEVSATKTKYLFRSISNAITNPYWNTSSGKPLLSAQNIVTTPRTNTIRYGGNYVQGTKINNISSFFSLDSNDVAIENGEITGLQRASRLQGNGSMMIVLCKRESAYIMLGEQELSQGNNASIRSLTANMIGTIRNFGNNLGMIDKRSVMNYKGTIWWWDDFNKKVVKYTPDGIEIPSDTYMRSTFRSKSGIANFSYDPFHNMCFIAVGNETQSLGYSDNLKRWIAAYDFVPSFAESYGDRMLLFKTGSGILYRSLESNSKTDYNAFFGNSAANGNIKFVVNSQLPVMPLNVAVLHNMNVIDYNQPNYIKSSLLTVDITNENGQTSAINETNWLLEDNRIYAHVMRDSSSTGGIIEGNYIVGYLNNFLLTLKDKTQNMRVNSIDIEVSPITGHS
jgi:hypothetical protein